VLESAPSSLAGLPAHRVVLSGSFILSKLLSNECLLKNLFGGGLDELGGAEGLGGFNLGNMTGLPDISSGPGLTFGSDVLLVKILAVFAVNKDQVYTISYSGLSDSYQSFLPVALKMIESFQVSGSSHVNDTKPSTNLGSGDNNITMGEDPLHILKVRLAKGEITPKQYEELRKLIEP
jgi:uncharacterized membrane protein